MPMKWPPKVARLDMIGEVRDTNGRNIPRDIGRPVYIGGNTYYTFGDTFCFDDNGQFVGGTNNTVAFVPQPRKQPHFSQYLEQQPHVSLYVPHTQSETAWENEPEHKKANDRVTCWPFGGIIETSPGQGWTFFDKMLTHGGQGGHHFGMGVARVSVKDGNQLHVERPMGENMIFGTDEPRFGSITHVVDDGWVYLLGGWDKKPPFEIYNFWARIRLDADFTKRENYDFQVRGGAWQKTYENNDKLKPINNMDIQAQGAVIKCPELAPPGKPFMWFGVNKYMANHLYIGCSPHIDGPWEVEDGGEIPNDPAGHTGARYALYPHNRSCDPGKGLMLLSWSDAGQMGGKVNMAVYHFEKDDGSPPEPQRQFEQMGPKKGGFDGGAPQATQGSGQGGEQSGGHGIGGKLKGLFK